MESKISRVFYLWDQGLLSSAELAGLYILLQLDSREKSKNKVWWSGVRKPPAQIVRFGRPLPWKQLENCLMAPSRLLKNFPDPSLAELFAYTVIHSFPESALKALKNLALNTHYKVKIFISIPSPKEVLQLQTEGIRPLSLLKKTVDLIGPPKECHDLLSLAVHDLTHVEQFFGDIRQHQAQVGFFKLIQSILDGPIQSATQKNPMLKKDFHYLISDMNSHCVHLLKYLESTLTRHGENLLYQSILSSWEIPNQLLTVACHVNHPGHTAQTYLELEDFFFSRF